MDQRLRHMSLISRNRVESWVWEHMLGIPALGRWRQAPPVFCWPAVLAYMAGPKPARVSKTYGQTLRYDT